MDFNLLSGVFTAFSMLVFAGIVYWAYSGENRNRFEKLGNALIDSEDPTAENKQTEENHG